MIDYPHLVFAQAMNLPKLFLFRLIGRQSKWINVQVQEKHLGHYRQLTPFFALDPPKGFIKIWHQDVITKFFCDKLKPLPNFLEIFAISRVHASHIENSGLGGQSILCQSSHRLIANW